MSIVFGVIRLRFVDCLVVDRHQLRSYLIINRLTVS